MKRKLLVVLMATVFVAACSPTWTINPPELPDPKDMTPQELAGYALDLYNSQWDYHQERTKNPKALTEEQKQDLRDLKAMLIEIYPYLIEFGDLIKSGLPVSESLRNRIIIWIEDITVYRE